MAEKKKTIASKATSQPLHHLLLRLAIEIDQDIAAENHIKMACWWIRTAHKIQVLEIHHCPNFRHDLHLPFLLVDPFEHVILEQELGDVAGFADVVNATKRQRQNAGGDVGRENAHFPALLGG